MEFREFGGHSSTPPPRCTAARQGVTGRESQAPLYSDLQHQIGEREVRVRDRSDLQDAKRNSPECGRGNRRSSPGHEEDLPAAGSGPQTVPPARRQTGGREQRSGSGLTDGISECCALTKTWQRWLRLLACFGCRRAAQAWGRGNGVDCGNGRDGKEVGEWREKRKQNAEWRPRPSGGASATALRWADGCPRSPKRCGLAVSWAGPRPQRRHAQSSIHLLLGSCFRFPSGRPPVPLWTSTPAGGAGEGESGQPNRRLSAEHPGGPAAAPSLGRSATRCCLSFSPPSVRNPPQLHRVHYSFNLLLVFISVTRGMHTCRWTEIPTFSTS